MSYLGHRFQNRWLSDRFITTKSSSTERRHRSICSMQIEPYQGPWGIYTGNGGKLDACMQRSNTSQICWPFYFYNYFALIVTVLTRQLVSSTREHFLVESIFTHCGIPISAQQNSAFQRYNRSAKQCFSTLKNRSVDFSKTVLLSTKIAQ